jgi:DegV family protein with EDD domain
MIRIVTDSTCDLPEKFIRELKVTVVPLYINIGDEGYLDGVELTRSEFYSKLPDFPTHPTTGTPSPELFETAYRDLLENGVSQVLSIHISEHLSGTVNVARTVANRFKSGQVVIRDSEQLSYGTGFQVETAARMAAEGKSMDEILETLADMAQRTLVAATLDTLEYLRRSGRMNRFMKGIGSLIQLKPILTMEKSIPGSLMARTRERAYNRLVRLLEGYQPVERFVLLHTHAPEEAETFLELVDGIIPSGEIPSFDITPVIGAHLGPKAVGFAVMTKTQP